MTTEERWAEVEAAAVHRDRVLSLVSEDEFLSAANRYAVEVGDHSVSVRARETVDRTRHPRNPAVQPIAQRLPYIRTGEKRGDDS